MNHTLNELDKSSPTSDLTNAKSTSTALGTEPMPGVPGVNNLPVEPPISKKHGNKNKKKKVSAKRERYAKFRKSKPEIMTFTTPDLTPEQIKQRQEDEGKIGLFLRYNRGGHASKGIGAKSKR